MESPNVTVSDSELADILTLLNNSINSGAQVALAGINVVPLFRILVQEIIFLRKRFGILENSFINHLSLSSHAESQQEAHKEGQEIV